MKTLWTIRKRLLAAVLCLCMILPAFVMMDTAYVLADALETTEETVLSSEQEVEEAHEDEDLLPTVDPEEKFSEDSENEQETETEADFTTVPETEPEDQAVRGDAAAPAEEKRKSDVIPAFVKRWRRNR